jgi:hypothetical protein
MSFFQESFALKRAATETVGLPMRSLPQPFVARTHEGRKRTNYPSGAAFIQTVRHSGDPDHIPNNLQLFFRFAPSA